MNKLTNNENTLFIDQYGQHFWAKNLKELREQINGKVSKMYMDNKDNDSIAHVGYVIGKHWLTAFKPVMVAA